MMLDVKSILPELSGLCPTALLSVGGGYVREEVKSLFFKYGHTISARAIVNPKQLCQLLIQKEISVLGDGAAVELLRRLFKSEIVRGGLPTLSEQRFRPRFYEKLHSSLQQGRRFFTHSSEADVLSQRLDEVLGKSLKRSEFFLLNQFWENILKESELWDEARLLEAATQVCIDSDLSFLKVQKIYLLEHFKLPPRAQNFWNELSKKIAVIKIPEAELTEKIPLKMVKAHSLEDAVFYLFDEIARGKIEDHALVIQDQPKIRRTVQRMAKLYGIPFFDPRDPMSLTLSEEIKSSLLEFEMVSKNFPGELVCQWISLQKDLKETAGTLRVVIQERGIQTGINSYSGEKLLQLQLKLKEVEARWPKRISLRSLRNVLMQLGREAGFWGRFFDEWVNDFALLEIQEQKRPLRIWYEQLVEKLRTARPQSESARIKGGLALYRVDQAVSFKVEQDQTLHFFGIAPDFFEAREWTNDWFTQREVEVLAREFGLPSKRDLMTEREESFLRWANAAPSKLWTYEYDENGTEADSLELSLATMEILELDHLPELEAHPRLLPAWTAELKLAKTALALPRALKTEQSYSMSFLDDYSECPFLAYGAHIMKAYDEREPDYELMGDSFGQLMHVALEKLIRDRLSPAEAFEVAWKISLKKCWYSSDRILASVRNRAVSLLTQFQEQENAYRERSLAEPLAMEDDLKLELKRDGFTFTGRADRIDQYSEGLVVFDYKTQSTLTPGRKMLENGKSLQLALYGLALKDRYNQEVVGAHFIQLTKAKVNRNQGIIFKKWNGKKVDRALTLAGATSHSLIDLEPEVAWKQLNEQVIAKIRQLKSGDFSPKAVDPKDCETCRYQLSCGWLRRSRSGETLTADEGFDP